MSEKVVKRYDPFGYDGLSALMREDAHGDWVRGEDYDALHAEAEALRAENAAALRVTQSLVASVDRAEAELEALRSQLEAARGLLLEAKRLRNAVNIYPGRTVSAWSDSRMDERIDAFLTSTPVPEVQRCQTCDGTGDVHRADGEWLGECHCAKAKQAQRQENGQ